MFVYDERSKGEDLESGATDEETKRHRKKTLTCISILVSLFIRRVGRLIVIGIYIVQVLIKKTSLNIFPYLENKQFVSYF